MSDVMQETYLAIFQNIGKLKETKAALGWMKQIAFHKGMDHFRKNHKELQNNMQDDEMEQSDMITDELWLPENIMENQETQSMILKLIEELPVDQRRAILAYYYSEVKVSEIAELLQMSVNTVKTNLSRGRKRLKESIECMEKQQGVCLHSYTMAPLLFLVLSLRAERENVPIQISTEMMTGISRWAQNQASIGVTSSMQQSALKKAVSRAAFRSSVGKKFLIGLLSAGMVTGGGLAAYHYYFTSTPEKTIEEFEQAFNDANLDAMIACMDSHTQTTYSKAGQVINIFGLTPQKLLDCILDVSNSVTNQNLSVIDLKVNKITYSDSDMANVVCTLNYENEAKKIRIWLVKEEHQWKIDFKRSEV